MKISFTLPEEPFWHGGIYQLETTDRVLGWDPELEVDGPANAQWTQLAERTLYLRELFAKEHDEGHHSFNAGDFVEDLRIPEEKLALDHATKDIGNTLNNVISGIHTQYERMEKYSDVDISSSSVLSRLVPYVREYFKGDVDFDLFNDHVSLQTFLQTRITREIAGDDSLDVESTKGLQPGSSYFIFDLDGKRVEEATVWSVLSENRVRFTRDLDITRTSGYLSSCNIILRKETTYVKSKLVYLTEFTDIFEGENITEGQIYVHRENADIRGRVWHYNGKIWQLAKYVGTKPFFDGTIDEIFSVPPGRVKLRFEYPAAEKEWQLYYIALKAIKPYVLPEQVRRPKILEITRNENHLEITGNEFASLWDLEQRGIEACISSRNAYGDNHYHVENVPSRNIALDIPARLMLKLPLLAKIRHIDVEGVPSRWSESFEVV